MPIAVARDPDSGWSFRRIDDNSPAAPLPDRIEEPGAAAQLIGELEAAEHPRWILASTATTYPVLREYGVRLARGHDLELVEALLLGAVGDWGAPRTLAAARARMLGLPVHDTPSAPGFVSAPDPPALFDRPVARLPGEDLATVLSEVYADQQHRIEDLPAPAAFGLLCAADCAGALLAVEMTEAGIPWDVDVHNEVLADLLGPRTPTGVRPAKLASLAGEIQAAFGGRSVNPDSPADLLTAFDRDGVPLQTTRSWVLRNVEHPAVAPLLAYKELSRIHTANGWAWQSTWIRDGRLRPEYIPAGVVSGRWATRGGGALQIPRRLRRAVVADPGRVLVVADAAQLEPRILAAMSRDPAMARAAGSSDMYAALAAESFGGDRAKAKVGLLGAMYGQVGGGASAPLAVLRARYPKALALLEDAAWAGERGQLVRSHLGRTCPPPSRDDPTPEQRRARGRFTRNFVVQATAAEWAETLLAYLRGRLHGLDGTAQIVFYQHDEVMVHVDSDAADAVVDAVHASAGDASRLLFGDTPVRLPMEARAARVYADASH